MPVNSWLVNFCYTISWYTCTFYIGVGWWNSISGSQVDNRFWVLQANKLLQLWLFSYWRHSGGIVWISMLLGKLILVDWPSNLVPFVYDFLEWINTGSSLFSPYHEKIIRKWRILIFVYRWNSSSCISVQYWLYFHACFSFDFEIHKPYWLYLELVEWSCCNLSFDLNL